jgi:hypothetical protein
MPNAYDPAREIAAALLDQLGRAKCGSVTMAPLTVLRVWSPDSADRNTPLAELTYERGDPHVDLGMPSRTGNWTTFPLSIREAQALLDGLQAIITAAKPTATEPTSIAREEEDERAALLALMDEV